MRKLSLHAVLIVTLFGMLHLPTAQGAVNAYLKIEGVNGESRAEGHKDWIELSSVSWGTTGGGRATSSDGPRGAGPGSLTVTKNRDTASPKLMEYCASGKHVKQALLHMRDSDSEPFREYVLYDLYLSSDSPSDTDVPMESISLNYGKIKFAPQRKTPKAKVRGPQRAQ